MKRVTFLITVAFLFSLESFISPATLYARQEPSSSDSIPALNKQIIDFVTSKLKKRVGSGECWDLAAEALNKVNASWNNKYRFGKEINPKEEQVFPGDIIQFDGVVLKYEVEGKKYTEKMLHHTAIIYNVKDRTNFTLAHQNTAYSGKRVGLSPLEINTITKGKFKIYRPEKSGY